MPKLVTEITTEEIAALREGASAAIAEVTEPASLEKMNRAKHVEAARKLIAKIPEMIREQGSNKEKAQSGFVSVLDLDSDCFKEGSPFDGVPWTEENLVGVAEVVFKACRNAGLEPYIGKWWQFVGGNHHGICIPLNDTGREHAVDCKENQQDQ